MLDFFEIALVALLSVLTAVIAAAVIFFIRRDAERLASSDRKLLTPDREYLNQQIEEILGKVYKTRGKFDEINRLAEESVQNQENLPPTHDSIARSIEIARNSRFLKSVGISVEEVVRRPQQVFYLTPFSQKHLAAFRVTQSVCSDLGLQCIRGDEMATSEALLPFIVRQIIGSRFIIANMTGRNANVFYELGISQMLEKRVLLISHAAEEIEFDLRHQKILLYRDLVHLEHQLHQAIARLSIDTLN